MHWDGRYASVGFLVKYHFHSKDACAKQGHERLGALPVQTYPKCHIMYSEKASFPILARHLFLHKDITRQKFSILQL